MDGKRRMEATAAIWGALSFAMFGLFLSGGMADGVGVMHLIITIVLVLGGFLGTGLLWNWGTIGMFNEMNAGKTSSHEKPKRDRIEQALRDLSNEELVVLKQRLSSGEINDDVLHQYMAGDDGERVDYR